APLRAPPPPPTKQPNRAVPRGGAPQPIPPRSPELEQGALGLWYTLRGVGWQNALHMHRERAERDPSFAAVQGHEDTPHPKGQITGVPGSQSPIARNVELGGVRSLPLLSWIERFDRSARIRSRAKLPRGD